MLSFPIFRNVIVEGIITGFDYIAFCIYFERDILHIQYDENYKEFILGIHFIIFNIQVKYLKLWRTKQNGKKSD